MCFVYVLETVRKELEKELAMCSKLQLGLAHRTVRWCTRQCLVRQAGPRELAALGIRRQRTTKIHQTVWWIIHGELVALGNEERRRG